MIGGCRCTGRVQPCLTFSTLFQPFPACYNRVQPVPHRCSCTGNCFFVSQVSQGGMGGCRCTERAPRSRVRRSRQSSTRLPPPWSTLSRTATQKLTTYSPADPLSQRDCTLVTPPTVSITLGLLGGLENLNLPAESTALMPPGLGFRCHAQRSVAVSAVMPQIGCPAQRGVAVANLGRARALFLVHILDK